MSPQQINRAIAESLGEPLYLVNKSGWFYRPGGNGYTAVESDAWKLPYSEAVKHVSTNADVPVTIQPCTPLNFTDSLDACRLFEEKINPNDEIGYMEELSQYVEYFDPLTHTDLFKIATATPLQRCEAYLRMKGIWREEV